ncbi:MAG TPA: hypothetical protein VFM18_21150 [Methanosarcina sp.]|nr:hypothetical protein [Methanosarcina sp.]
MTAYYQPPLTPLGNQIGVGGSTGNYAMTKSPYFSLANQFLPRNLHDVIRWARFITVQSPVTTEVVRKLSTYPVTEFVIDCEKRDIVETYQKIFKSFRLKTALHDIGFDYHTLGNVFLSIYFPIQRSLICRNCRTAHNAKTAEFAQFKNYEFVGTCPKCNFQGAFERSDTKSTNIDDMNIIKWDPLNIAVNHNVITGEYEYYYKIPNEVRRRILQGDKLFVDSIPWGFIEAVRKKQDYKFDNNYIYHLKNTSTGHMVDGISIPPLISQYNLVYYIATLRKANEAIASDFMSPMRVVFPQAQTGNSDPVIALSMKNFVSNMQSNFMQFKQDPNHVVIAPVPIGYQAISGEGKTLLVSQEIAQAEQSLLLSMGVSQELLSGTTNWTSSTVGLRMLENTLNSYVSQLHELIQWLMLLTCKYLGIEHHEVNLSPFRLTDDDNLRQFLMTAVGTGNASWSTLYESYGIDYEDELRRIREDAAAAARNKVQTDIEVERATYLASKDAAERMGQDEEYKSALARAQQLAEELSQVDESTKRQTLNQLKIEDLATYLMTSKLLEEINTANNHALQADAMNQAAAGQTGADNSPKDGTGATPDQSAPQQAAPAQQPNA